MPVGRPEFRDGDIGKLADLVAASLISSLAGYFLEVLARTSRPLSGRQVSRLVARESSHVGVQKVLDELASQGIVDHQEYGSTILNTLNRDHSLTCPMRDQVDIQPVARTRNPSDQAGG